MPEPQPQSAPQPDFWEGLLQALLMGMRNSSAQIQGDISDLSQGQNLKAIGGRMMDVAGELPVGKIAKKAASPLKGIIDKEVWKSMQPEAKVMLNNLADKFPDFFKKLLESPTSLKAEVGPMQPGIMGSLGITRPTIANAVQRGDKKLAEMPVAAMMNVDPGAARAMQVPVHESQHLLNFPRVQGTDPADAATIGMLLSELLPGMGQGSLRSQMNKFGQVANPGYAGRMAPLAGSRPLQQMAKLPSNPLAFRNVNQGQGYYKPMETYQDFLGRSMMDEGFAHLAEQTTTKRNPMLLELAKALGVGVGR